MGRVTCKIGTCPDCDDENVKITSAGICTKCYKRMHNAKSRGKEYIPYKLAEPSKRGKKRVKSVKQETPVIEKPKKEKSQESQVKIEDPNLYCLVDLKLKGKKLEEPIDIESFYDSITDLSQLVCILKDAIGVKAIDRANNINNMINETSNIYKHRLEAAYDTPQEKEMYEKFKAMDKVRRKFKKHTGAILVINSVLNNPNDRKIFIDKLDYIMKALLDYYGNYTGTKQTYLEEDITNDIMFQENIRPTQRKSYRVDIITDRRNNRHFIQDRWAFSEEDALEKVKKFLDSHGMGFIHWTDEDVTITEISEDNEYDGQGIMEF